MQSGAPGIEELEARMQPGAFSRVGFLGPGERLQDVLEADARTLEELHLDYGQLATPLDTLIVEAERSPRRRAEVDNRFQVEVEIHTGFQICPWALDPNHSQCTAGQGVQHASADWFVRNLKTGRELRGPGLIVHLVRDHHFFLGLGSPLRVDPRELARLLDLV
jgi:hypothetical protein